jgi:3-deoxy-manno-octulosonate cytidylyltransferase (CMP-KDO synthetase)
VHSIIVIPARLASTRLPRKLLLAETGKPLIQHTCEAATRATKANEVIVAADREEIAEAVRRFGGRVEMTSPDCATGTDRVAEVALRHPEAEILVNVQGDEPEIRGQAIDLAIERLESDAEAVMSTLATPIRERAKLDSPSCVKVVVNRRGRALYFSRAPIPYPRDWHDSLLTSEPPSFLQHIGVYAYRRDFLLRIAGIRQAPIERIESLEQLRVLHEGYAISVGVIDEPTVGIDTREDYDEFLRRQLAVA